MKRICFILAVSLMAAAFPQWIMAQTNAAALFKSKCVLCHSEDGSGNSPSGKALKAKDLRSEEVQKKSDVEITQVISKGQNKMPAFGQKLTPDQIEQLVAYIRHLGKK